MVSYEAGECVMGKGRKIWVHIYGTMHYQLVATSMLYFSDYNDIIICNKTYIK
jgi:hypothetical protein